MPKYSLMIKKLLQKIYKPLLWIGVIFIALYGLGRLYYYTTGGFSLGNITYELPYDSRWEISPLASVKMNELQEVLDQNFYYLGKGCQSYVFESGDGKYVLKFIKYQRFRPRPWLDYLTFIPVMNRHFQDKTQAKQEKLKNVFISWKIAYEILQKETGVLYVHLNKSKSLNKTLIIFDKMGLKHPLDIDNYEFLIQRKADMLCPTLNKWMAEGDIKSSQELITQLLSRIISEYERGYADNDHALMQNTGVLDHQPVHVDVGQFVKNNRVLNVTVRNQELFNKTWKFRKWLEKHHPVLAEYSVQWLKDFMGKEQFSQLVPRLNKAEMGVLSHQSE
jgi:hypothetical protein